MKKRSVFFHLLLLFALVVIFAACKDGEDESQVQNGDKDAPVAVLTISYFEPVSETILVNVGSSILFSADASTTVDGANLSYKWTINGKSAGDNSGSLQLHIIAEMVKTDQEIIVVIRDGINSVSVGWTLKANSIPHSQMNRSYTGPESCSVCHPEALDEILDTVHYRFEAATPDEFIKLIDYDENGDPTWDNVYLTDDRTGKLYKVCAFPHAYAGANWIGILNDEKQTPGGCARCHIANGTPPNTLTGDPEPSDEQRNSIDCLICHATDYNGGAPAPKRMPTKTFQDAANDAYGDWTSGLRFSFDDRVEAFQSVGAPTSAACLRCHEFAGGGLHAKRGSGYAWANDVHANPQFRKNPDGAVIGCVECHSAGGHKTERSSINIDTWAYDNIKEGSSCVDCHSDAPHSDNTIYNKHFNGEITDLSCQVCHVSREGCCGVIEKDFTSYTYSDETGTYSPAAVVESAAAENIVYRWFDGYAYKPLVPMGEGAPGAKVYPFKIVKVRKLIDADNKVAPLKLGILFKNGLSGTDQDGNGFDDNLDKAAIQGEKLGNMIGGPAGNTDPADSPLAATVWEEEYFNLDHGITSEPFVCIDCHSSSPVINWSVLGLAPNH